MPALLLLQATDISLPGYCSHSLTDVFFLHSLLSMSAEKTGGSYKIILCLKPFRSPNGSQCKSQIFQGATGIHHLVLCYFPNLIWHHIPTGSCSFTDSWHSQHTCHASHLQHLCSLSPRLATRSLTSLRLYSDVILILRSSFITTNF